jgi:hypothetical protein
MKLMMLSLLGAGLVHLAPFAHAQEVIEFNSAGAWQVGDASEAVNAQGLDISLKITSSTLTDRVYVRGEFCDDGSGGGTFGMRVTATYPERSHATIRVPAGGCARWSEHLKSGLRTYYVFIKCHVG